MAKRARDVNTYQSVCFFKSQGDTARNTQCKSGNPQNSYANNTGKRTAAVPWYEALARLSFHVCFNPKGL